MLSPDRLSLPGPEYLAQRHVLTYMEDAVSQLLENREDTSQYGIARFFTEYFNSVRQGTHILFREFSFVQATPHNRASFLRTFWRCFRTVGKNGEFLESVAVIYQDLLAGKNPNTVIVPTSSSGQHRQRQPSNDCSPLDGVEASLFYQCLESLCDRSKYSCPPSALVKEMLSSAQRLTFYGFLMALAKDQGINRALGALPDKGDLFLDPAMDQELEKLIAQVSGLSVSGPTSSSGDTANLPVRNSSRINSPWKPLYHRRKMDAESEGSNEETDSSEN
ncbi:centriolar satellite-associated tubulin polyglutamylase complex regulator 1 isoform X3 [Opisthocomus hoazin]|uniref:centriolar satellite-associated tubulin polyglutamylase complex regulator 1 isoform X3 n=1 Tax=Opisthocomus hoazin TaxID=30419 RepID=UPI003F52B2A7